MALARLAPTLLDLPRLSPIFGFLPLPLEPRSPEPCQQPPGRGNACSSARSIRSSQITDSTFFLRSSDSGGTASLGIFGEQAEVLTSFLSFRFPHGRLGAFEAKFPGCEVLGCSNFGPGISGQIWIDILDLVEHLLHAGDSIPGVAGHELCVAGTKPQASGWTRENQRGLHRWPGQRARRLLASFLDRQQPSPVQRWRRRVSGPATPDRDQTTRSPSPPGSTPRRSTASFFASCEKLLPIREWMALRCTARIFHCVHRSRIPFELRGARAAQPGVQRPNRAKESPTAANIPSITHLAQRIWIRETRNLELTLNQKIRVTATLI